MTPADSIKAIAENGILVVIAALALSSLVYYATKVLPGDRQYQRKLTETIVEQVSLSRQALETSNEVIRMNSGEMKDNRASHARIGERLEGVETSVVKLAQCVEQHDKRAEDIAKDTTAIRVKLGV